MEITPKTKLKFELHTFVTILIFVFGLGGTYISLHMTQDQIIEKLDTIAVLQKDMVVVRDAQHSEIDKTFAWVVPAVHTISRKLGLE